MLITKTLPAAALQRLVAILNTLANRINRAEFAAQDRLDVAAVVAFEAKAGAIKAKLDNEARLVEGLRDMLRRAEDRLTDLQGESVDSVFDLHSEALRRQGICPNIEPELPEWVTELDRKLFENAVGE